MTPPRIFIASSSEGLDVVKAVRSLLLENLGDRAEQQPWTRAFELSATYIESLEKAAAEADFAVLVATSDDIVISRGKKKAAPRDNVLFELGLFMGCLGRERCFVVNEDRPDMKVLSDLLGVHTAAFRRSANLKASLDGACLAIAEQIAKLGSRYKPGRDALALQSGARGFCESIEGPWWERMPRGDSESLSFFRIGWDPAFNAVSLTGKVFDSQGCHIANWNSIIGRADHNECRIRYQWEGWHTTRKLLNVPFSGFGEMTFDKPLKPGEPVSRGGGKYWDVDESHPEKTGVKPTEIRRVVDERVVAAMTGGNRKAIQAAVKKTLREW